MMHAVVYFQMFRRSFVFPFRQLAKNCASNILQERRVSNNNDGGGGLLLLNSSLHVHMRVVFKHATLRV